MPLFREGVFKASTDHAIFFDDDDLYINFDRFENDKKYNACFVVGYSGSGKSTLSKELSKKYKAELLSMDTLMYPESAEQMLKETTSDFKTFYKFLRNNPQYVKFIERQFELFSTDKFTNSDERKATIEKRKWAIKIVKYCLKEHHKMIIEGIDLYHIFSAYPDLLEYPIIIKGTSKFKSIYRNIMRRDNFNLSPNSILDLLDWYNQQQSTINNFRVDLEDFMKQ